MQRAEPFGCRILLVNETTRIWKGAQALKQTDLKTGDEIRLNLTAELPSKPSSCAGLWIVDNPVKL
jgi:hypothetical protein